MRPGSARCARSRPIRGFRSTSVRRRATTACLNVWASSNTSAGAGKPVMVWVHGGAYVLGSSAQSLYHGRALAADGDAVIVTVNYRLEAPGFLDLSAFGVGFATNVGLRDVLFALQWVRENITGFGGDPDRVTVFGESAGGHHHHTAEQSRRGGPVRRGDCAELARDLHLRPGAWAEGRRPVRRGARSAAR
jgi:carboxylesterase type B